MRRFIENESSKLEHLQIELNCCHYSAGTLPTKLPSNLKSFSLYDPSDGSLSIPILNAAKDCKNLKLLHLEINMFGTLTPNAILAIGNIQSLVYLNFYFSSIENETTFKNIICGLPNLKALNIGGYCSTEEMISNICRARPDLVHLNVSTRNAFQIPDSLNSLTLRIPSAVKSQFLPELLFEQPNKSIQHLDIRSIILPSSSNFMEKLLGQFPDLESLHCKMPVSNADLTSFFPLIKKHLANGRKITIYFHFYDQHYEPAHYKYILPDDFPQFDTDVDWKPKMYEGTCENLVLKKLIKEAIDGGNNPSFLDEWWME